ncbi:hypothetical protein HPB50_023373 [Hyalomma asiaticum]|uniref:Uncharacterized protein n=1 Tax=Hyalomma asiaticum TaxID=266040 RepID=A0ACB7TTQ8_HYAAI|nr:hypothetical protein HPB50_023373 [Hyalomma asiaticum]
MNTSKGPNVTPGAKKVSDGDGPASGTRERALDHGWSAAVVEASIVQRSPSGERRSGLPLPPSRLKSISGGDILPKPTFSLPASSSEDTDGAETVPLPTGTPGGRDTCQGSDVPRGQQRGKRLSRRPATLFPVAAARLAIMLVTRIGVPKTSGPSDTTLGSTAASKHVGAAAAN